MNAKVLKNKVASRLKRKRRIRAKIHGSATLPRVSVFAIINEIQFLY